MQASTANKIVLISAAGVFGAGWFNANRKGNKLPSKKFFVGTGLSFTFLSFLADLSPDVAAALAGAMLTTVMFNDGGGILKYMNDNGEISTPNPNRISNSTNKTLNHITRVAQNDVGQIPGLTSHGQGSVSGPYLTPHPQH